MELESDAEIQWYNGEVKSELFKQLTIEQRTEGSKGMNHAYIWGEGADSRERI